MSNIPTFVTGGLIKGLPIIKIGYNTPETILPLSNKLDPKLEQELTKNINKLSTLIRSDDK